MSKYNSSNVGNLCWNGKRLEGFADGSFIEVKPKDITIENKNVSSLESTIYITLTLTEDSARKIQYAVDNAEFVIGFDNERICPLCEGQNDYKVVDSIEGHPCEIKTYCTVCAHEDYWAYGHYETKYETGEFI